jgi:hypothetical protein
VSHSNRPWTGAGHVDGTRGKKKDRAAGNRLRRRRTERWWRKEQRTDSPGER